MSKWMRRLLKALPWLAVLLSVLTALFLVVSVDQGSTQLGQHALWVFALAAIALFVLLALIVGRLVRLRARVKADEPGARLTYRLIKIFSALALPPVLVLYLFSLEFLGETVEGWLDVQTEDALAQSIELGQLFLDLRTRAVRSDLQRIALAVDLNDDTNLYGELLGYVSANGPTEISLLTEAGQSELMVHIDPREVIPNLPNQFALSQALANGEYAAAEPSNDGLMIRIMRRMEPTSFGAEPLIVQAIYPLPEQFVAMASDIERAYYRYQNVSFLRARLQQSLVLILSLVLLLTALLAIVLAFNAARRVSQPIKDLAQATEELAAGRFPDELITDAQDELGFLVKSFNTMTQELAQSRQALEAQRRYLEIVLGRLSSGVLAVDASGQLTALNRAAADILGLSYDSDRTATLAMIRERHPKLAPLLDVLIERLNTRSGEWRQEIQIIEHDRHQSRPLVLVARGSDLGGEMEGHVVVFDDVTVLDQAQREAAWAEVAKRLAHEVKNPLTPIQLAAERLDYKLGDKLEQEDAALLHRATTTIGAQVDALRRLVDAFGDYAKPKPSKMERVDLHRVIGEVIDLYQSADQSLSFDFKPTEQAIILADAGKVRQVLLNLMANAQEACGEGELKMAMTTAPSDRLGGSVCLECIDNGPGFPEQILSQVFEPYVTTKPGGTGLGLAIVRRIVEEHGGEIAVSNLSDQAGGGACVRIWWPTSL